MQIDKYYLLPGAIFSSKTPHIVDTILGSCVSVYLWDVVLKFGCINHYMLPGQSSDKKNPFKYGDIAMLEIIKRMKAFGSERANIKAKIFGGSETGDSQGIFNIGERNVTIANEMLQSEGIPVLSSSVGGKYGRKLIFHTAT